MENIFVVLAIIGSVIYKIYTSYKEEMEKAAKRRQPARPPVPAQTTPPVQQRIPVPVPPPVVPTARKPQYVQPPIPPVQQKKTLPDEVKKIQQARLEREKIRARQQEEESPATATFQFDLRQAVIQSAILERPYK